jgi:hypothetical protein
MCSQDIVLEQHEFLFEKFRGPDVFHQRFKAVLAECIGSAGCMDDIGQIVGLIPAFLAERNDTGLFRHRNAAQIERLHNALGKLFGGCKDRLRRLLDDAVHGLPEGGFLGKHGLDDPAGADDAAGIIVCIGKAADAFMLGEEIVEAAHQHDIVIAAVDQIFGHIVDGFVIVERQEIGIDVFRKALDEDGRNIAADQAVLEKFRILRLAGDEDHAGTVPARKFIDQAGLQLRRIVGKRDVQGIPGFIGARNDALQDLGMAQVVDVRENDADFAGRTGLQGPGGFVGYIAEVLDRLHDPVPGLLFYAFGIVDTVGYGCNGYPAPVCNVFQCRHTFHLFRRSGGLFSCSGTAVPHTVPVGTDSSCSGRLNKSS